MITNTQKKALIIGISDYTPPLQKLDFCRNDAKRMNEVLESQKYEIEKIVGEAKWETVRKTIRDFFDEGSSYDTLLFYYSGHGVLDDHGDIYLALSDTDPNDPLLTGYSFEEFTKMIGRTKSARVIVILDCCYSGSLKIGKGSEKDAARKWRRIMEEKSKNLREQQQIHVKCILAASHPYQEAFAKGEHSIFTKYLLKGLEGGDGNDESIDNEGQVTAQLLGDYVYRAIKRSPTESHQDPIVTITEGFGNIILASYPKLKPLKIENTLASMLKLLREGNVQEFNKMREANSAILPEPDFSRGNLHGAHIAGANLSNANLNKIDLSGADLEEANLSNANLFRADLEGANLSNANCSNAVLEAAILSHANLTKANLANTNLTKANLYRAKMSSEHLQKARTDGAILNEPPDKTRDVAVHKGILRSKTKISIAVSVTAVALILATLYLLPPHHAQVIGAEPYDISINRLDNVVYVANHGDNTVSVIDGNTNKVTDTIPVGKWPIALSINPSTNTTYVANRDDDTISVIDGKTNKVTDTIQVGKSPWAVSLNPSTNMAYITNFRGNTISVIDGKTNKVTDTIQVGTNPSAVSINPSTNIAYVSNYVDNTVSVIDGKTNKVTDTIQVGKSPSAVSVNPSTNMAYVANQDNDTVSVIDGKTNKVTDTIQVGKSPNDLSVNPSTNMAYVANQNNNTVSVIDGKTNKVTDTIQVGKSPSAVSVNPSTNMAYVTNRDDNTVSVIDGKTNTLKALIQGR